MNDLQNLIQRFDEIIALENDETLCVLGGYIIGAILEQPHKLYESSSLLQTIDDHASRLELEDGTPEQLQRDWNIIKSNVKALKDSAQ